MPSKYLKVWTYLLLSANHSTARLPFSGEVVQLEPGQLITGRKVIAEKTGIKPGSVENILKWLESEQQIAQRKTSKGRMITVVNWERYQSNEQDSEQPVNNKVTTNEQQVDTNNNNKNKKNDKKLYTHTNGSALDLDKSPIFKNCTFTRLSDDEFAKLQRWAQHKGLAHNYARCAVEEVEIWLNGDSSEARKARKSKTHYSRCQAAWVARNIRERVFSREMGS